MAFDSEDITLAAQIKALGHPARLAIVRALSGERTRCCCGDLVRGLPLAQSTVSQHLKVLKQAGIIKGEIEGPRSCYWLDRAALAAIAEAVGRFEAAAPACMAEEGAR